MATLRVGTLNQLLFGGALLLLAGVLTVDTLSIIAERGAAQRTAEASRAGQELFAALQSIRTERGRTRVALMAAQPAAQATLDGLTKGRQAAAPAMERFLATCRKVDCASPAELDAIRSASTALESMRQQADHDLTLPLDKRAEGIAGRWGKSSTALIDLMERLSGKLSADIRLVDPIIGELVEIKQAGWAVRDYAGLVRNYYGEILQGAPLTPAILAKMIDNEARIDSAWAQVLDLTSRPGAFPAVVDAVKKAHDEYVERLQPMLVKIRTAASGGETPPITADGMMAYTDGALGVLIQVPETTLATTVAYAQSRADDATHRLIVSLVVFAVAVAVGAAGILVIRGRIVRPIDGIVTAMRRVADGKLDSDIPYCDRKDEIGELAAALEVFKANAVEKERLAAQQQQAQALREQRQKVIEAAIADFEAASSDLLRSFDKAASQMTGTSQSMSATAEQTTRQASAVVSASDLTSMNVQTVAGATEELSASIDEISRQVAQSATISGRAVEEARRTDETVHGLSNAASRIGEVVQIIQDIAAQTNLLALNATIEAARAGEAGKGFAVVAGEVKTLASQTARATDDIAQQIAAIQAVAQESVNAIRGIGSTIGEISGIATAIASAVEEQGAATRDIAQNVQQASQSVQDVSSNIAGVSHAAEQTGLASHEVMQASAEITRQAGDLRQQVASFLGRIRAA